MRRSTKKLAGPSLAHFFKRYFARQPELTPEQADRLARTAVRTFTSVRLRSSARQRPRPPNEVPDSPVPGRPPVEPEAPAGVPAAPARDRFARVASSISEESRRPQTNAAAEEAGATAPAPPFDPYAFGLVPTFQRKGRDGLMQQLETVGDVANLRKLARAQQIVLPLELRAGEATAEAVREGILAAVEKRIADRRAAAG